MAHRLEDIVGQLMRPVRDLKQNFNIDLSLLEEYLTEVALQHLNGVIVDFTTMAMLLQQAAAIYSRKVDFYEQSVYDMVDKSQATQLFPSQDEEADELASAEAESPFRVGRRRKRRHSEAFRDFAPIDLEPAPNISREVESVRPPPTLPKTYIEFERPPMMAYDARLTDYHGNEIGIASDFHVNWNIKDGMVADDLDSSAAMSLEMMVPIVVAVLDELRRLSPPTSGSDSGVEQADLPYGGLNNLVIQDREPQQQNIVMENQRKRRDRGEVEDRKKKRRKLTKVEMRTLASRALWDEVRSLAAPSDVMLDVFEESELEGSTDQWHRKLFSRGLRKLAITYDVNHYELNGFEYKKVQDKMGMRGFTDREISDQLSQQLRWLACIPIEIRLHIHPDLGSTLFDGITPHPRDTSAELKNSDCEDDGFFDSSDISHGSQMSHLEQSALARVQAAEERESIQSHVEAWHALVAPRIADAEKRSSFQVHQYCQHILDRLPPGDMRQFAQVVRGASQHDICRYFLASLFLANTGNVDIVKTAPPLSVEGFHLKLLSHDTSLYSSTNPFE